MGSWYFRKSCLYYYYLTVIVTAWTLDLKDYQPLILPIGAIIVSLSILMADNIVELEEFLSYKIYTWYQLLFSVAIPMLFYYLWL